MVTWLFQLVSAQLGSETRIYISYCNACVFLKYIMLLLLLLSLSLLVLSIHMLNEIFIKK